MIQATHVWGLYEKHPGKYGKLVGIFSSPDLARNCVLIQPLLTSDWTHREVDNSYLWITSAIDPDNDGQESFHFTVEELNLFLQVTGCGKWLDGKLLLAQNAINQSPKILGTVQKS